MVCVAYIPEWESLANALTRVKEFSGHEQQAKIDICNAVADRKIVVRVLDGDEMYPGDNVRVPRRLAPSDFDWVQSRPLKPWFIGPMPGQHYYWNGGDRPISLIELSTADVRAVLCGAASFATEVVIKQRPGSTKTSKAKNNLTSRKRHKRVKYHIERAVTALEKKHGKFPPDDISVSMRDRLITEWLRGDDNPVRPSKRTLREYFSQKRE